MSEVKIRYGKCFYDGLYDTISVLTRNGEYKLNLPTQFQELLNAIAMVHPKDQFSRKIGSSIVRGRIKRLNGRGYEVMPKYVLKGEIIEQ